MNVSLSGEFLDPKSLPLPGSSLTIALVCNIKGNQEAPQSTSHAVPPDEPTLTNTISPSHRANDLYAEWDTLATVEAVREALRERHTVEIVEAGPDALQKLVDLRPDIAFNIAEGLHGVAREAQMPAIFELLQIPYLGSDPLTLALCLDKARAKEILSYYGIATAPFSVVTSMDAFEDLRVRFPAIVKPLHEGSSKGIYDSCVARNIEDLEREVRTTLEVYHQPVLVEEFLPGREFTVAIMGNGAEARALPIVEITFGALPQGMNPIYSYEAKWILDTVDTPLDIYDCPANLTPELERAIVDMSLRTYEVLRCRDWTRVDVRLNGRGMPHILEVNPLPGILPRPEDHSCFPKAARAAGMTYSQLINGVLDISLKRHGLLTPQPSVLEII
jgi:D-alanine-D-alanine ligase